MTHGAEHPHCNGIKIQTWCLQLYKDDGAEWGKLRFLEQLNYVRSLQGPYKKGELK